MISDEKRRRIAKMLRDATEGHGDVPVIPDSEVFCILEIGTGFADGFADKTDVEALADLIDRPTTTRHGKFRTKYGRRPRAARSAAIQSAICGGATARSAGR